MMDKGAGLCIHQHLSVKVLPDKSTTAKTIPEEFLSHEDADTAAWSLLLHNDVGKAEWINVPEVSRPVHSSWKEFHKSYYYW